MEPVALQQIPAAESLLGCCGKMFSGVPAIKKMARNTGQCGRSRAAALHNAPRSQQHAVACGLTGGRAACRAR